MVRKIEIEFVKRQVKCVAELLDDLAPKTSEAVWQNLPQSGNVYHAKYASNEVYILVPPFAYEEPGLENPTITPTSGDLLYFHVPPGLVKFPEIRDVADQSALIDLAIFYNRDNLLISPSTGMVPGNRFGTITENLDEVQKACENIWREGFAGEQLIFRRLK